jgi:hypothetical protein
MAIAAEMAPAAAAVKCHGTDVESYTVASAPIEVKPRVKPVTLGSPT